MPRKAALDALERFRRDGAWSRQVMASIITKRGLDRRDGALASRLFYGVLQNMTLLDWCVGLYAKGKLEPKVRDILRLGAYQLLFMDRIPVSAAVSTSVQLTRACGYSRASGLVNAVLRRIGEHGKELPEIPGRGTADYLSIRYSHPAWRVEELIGLRGYEGAEAVLRADNEPAPVYIQTNTLRTSSAELARELGARPVPDVPDCLALDGGELTELPAFREGRFYVQDPAARMAVIAADPRPGMRVLDACSAPGGKSFAAAIAMENRGTVDACDISDGKLNLVMDGADRMGLDIIACHTRDARDIRGGDYDVVIADVPCSGLGVIRKKPDIRYRERRELDILPELQGELLGAIATAVKPGGRLVYSTCTWRDRENGRVVDAFLRDNPDFEKREERTFWPDLDGTDGFYVCRMERKNGI